ncbi:MAG: hypothetical protein ACXWUG_22420 [Polyangiales bacterium]
MDPRHVVLEIGRKLVESHALGAAYRSVEVDLLEYTRVVRETVAPTADRILRAEIEAWAERAIACEPRVAVASLEQILFPSYETRPSLETPPIDSAGDHRVLGFSFLAIALVIFVGAWAARSAGVSFTFERPKASPVEWGTAPRVPVAPLAAPAAAQPEPSDWCIEERNYSCVREELLPRVESLSPAKRRALRIACAALADYGCVLRVDSVR